MYNRRRHYCSQSSPSVFQLAATSPSIRLNYTSPNRFSPNINCSADVWASKSVGAESVDHLFPAYIHAGGCLVYPYTGMELALLHLCSQLY